MLCGAARACSVVGAYSQPGAKDVEYGLGQTRVPTLTVSQAGCVALGESCKLSETQSPYL